MACLLCDSINSRSSYVVGERNSALAFLNPRQRSIGATLVAPRRHVDYVNELTYQEFVDVIFLTREIGYALVQAFRPNALHTWSRLSAETPQRFLHHHFQVVPRYDGHSYSYAKSWELPLTPVEQLASVAETLRDTWSRLTLSKPSRTDHNHDMRYALSGKDSGVP
jgi:histidine triad (HIT) family protein